MTVTGCGNRIGSKMIEQQKQQPVGTSHGSYIRTVWLSRSGNRNDSERIRQQDLQQHNRAAKTTATGHVTYNLRLWTQKTQQYPGKVSR